MATINRFKNLTDTKSVSTPINRFAGLEPEQPIFGAPQPLGNLSSFGTSNTTPQTTTQSNPVLDTLKLLKPKQPPSETQYEYKGLPKPTGPDPLAFMGTEKPAPLKLPETIIPSVIGGQQKNFEMGTGAIQNIANQQKQITQPVADIAAVPVQSGIDTIKGTQDFARESTLKILNHPVVSNAMVELSKRASGTGMVSMVQAVGPTTFEEAYAANRAAQAGDPSKLNQFLYQLGDTVPQTAIGIALNFAPLGTGPALSTAYWTALSASEQIENRGSVTSLTNIGIDIVGDRMLGASIESMFKAPAKTLFQTIKQNFATEGGTEVAQDLLKMQNNYLNAKTPEEKAKILAEAKEYFTSGQVLMTLGVGGISGAGIAATSQVGQQALEKYAKMTPSEKKSGKMKIPFSGDEQKKEGVFSQTPQDEVFKDRKGEIDKTNNIFYGRHNQPLKVGDIVEQETMFGNEKVEIMSLPTKDIYGNFIVKVKNLADSPHPKYGVKKGVISEGDLSLIAGPEDMSYFNKAFNIEEGEQPVTSQIPEASKAITEPQNMAKNKEPSPFTPGPGYLKFVAGMEKMVAAGKMYPEDLTILKTLFEGTNDDLLGRLELTKQLIQASNTKTLGRFSPIGSSKRSDKNNISLRNNLTQMNQHPSRIFCHEFGHAGYAMVLTSEERHLVAEVYWGLGRAKARKLFESGLDSNPTYHSGDMQEFFAQSFAEYIMEYKVPAKEMKPMLRRLSELLFKGLKRLVNRGEQQAVIRLRPIFEKILSGDKNTPFHEFVNKEPVSFKQQLIELFKEPYPGTEPDLPLFPNTNQPPAAKKITKAQTQQLFNKPATPTTEAQTGEAPIDAFQGILDFTQKNLPPEIEIQPIEKVIESDNRTPLKERVRFIDYIRTPWKVFERMGIRPAYNTLLKAYEGYVAELPTNIDKITAWSKQVTPAANEKIFRFLDGENVQLSPEETKVAGEIKAWLSEWADRLGMDQSERLSEYITHIFPFGKGGEIPEEIALIINKKIPGSVYNPFLLQRKGAEGYLKDTWKALDAYVKRATRKVYMDPALLELKEASAKLTDVSQVNYLTRYVGAINLRPTELDTLIDNTIKDKVGFALGVRPWATMTKGIRKMISRAKIALSFTSFAKNLTQGVNTFSDLGTFYTGVGYVNLVKFGSKELEQNGVLIAPFIEDRTYSAVKKLAEKADNIMFMNMTASELVNRGAAYYGAKAKFIAGGITSKEFKQALGRDMPAGYTPTMQDAIDYGKAIAAKTQFIFGPLGTPVGLTSDTAKTATHFSTFGIKQAEFILDMVGEKEYAKLIRYLTSSMLLFSYIGSQFGMKWSDSLIPFRFGMPPALQFLLDVWGAIIGEKDDYGNTPSVEKRLKTIGSSLFTNIVPGGAQMKRTYEGVSAVNQGASKTAAGNFQYRIAQTPMNYVRGALFGKSNLPEAKTYYEEKGTKKTSAGRFQGL